MKTAMQEMLSYIRKTLPMDLDWPKMLETKAESLIEKEKEQIIESYYEGHTAPYFSPNGNDVEKQAKEYYNQTYNQNNNNERTTTDNDRVY